MATIKIKNDTKSKKITMVCQSKDCEKKNLKQPEMNFYKCHVPGFDRYPICKECIKNNVDDEDIETVYRALQMLNLPFIITIWEKSLEKSEQGNAFGRYMASLTSLKQYFNKDFKDSVFEKPKTEEEIKREKKEARLRKKRESQIYSEEWYGYFTEADIEYLEDYYKKLDIDENINDIMYVDTARKIALTSLEMNKAFNEMKETGNDKKYIVLRDTYDKLYKQFNNIKAQNKANSDSLGCFGVVFDKVEKNQWIPQYEPDSKDIYDHLLKQFSNINKSL